MMPHPISKKVMYFLEKMSDLKVYLKQAAMQVGAGGSAGKLFQSQYNCYVISITVV